MTTRRKVFLFDVDGTLCVSQQLLEEGVIAWLKRLSEVVDVGVVSGSDEAKVLRQFAVGSGEQLWPRAGIRYGFFENGVLAYDFQGVEPTRKLLHSGDVRELLGEVRYQDLINFCLRRLSEIRLPVKRDLMIETRRGVINVSPIGRRCSQQEREEFAAFDAREGVREKLCNQLNAAFGDTLQCCLGGQISVDVAPHAWTKRLVLDVMADTVRAEDVFFFGDNCGEGGNDYALFAALQPRSYWVHGAAECYAAVQECVRAYVEPAWR